MRARGDEVDCTHVVHLASIAGVDTVMQNPVPTMQISLLGTHNVLDGRSRAHGDIERVVDFSTSEVFGAHAYNVSEGDVTTLGAVGEARWTYAVSKLATEHLCVHVFTSNTGCRPALSGPLTSTGRARSARVRFTTSSCARCAASADDPQRRQPDPRLVLHRRHHPRHAAGARAPGGDRPHLQHRQPSLHGDDLQPGARDRAPGTARARRSSSSPGPSPMSSCASPTSTRPASCSASSRR
jgi:hypothetical protein